MKLVLIAAVARDGAIGRGNALLFTDPVDQRHFRATTLGHPVLMGRRTWQSLPERFRPLPGRRNIVLSRDPGFAAAGAEVRRDLAEALAALQDEPLVFVLGGAEIYAQALPLADELLLTEVDRDHPDADARFPAWPRADFDETSRSEHRSADGTRFAIVAYRRRS